MFLILLKSLFTEDVYIMFVGLYLLGRIELGYLAPVGHTEAAARFEAFAQFARFGASAHFAHIEAVFDCKVQIAGSKQHLGHIEAVEG